MKIYKLIRLKTAFLLGVIFCLCGFLKADVKISAPYQVGEMLEYSVGWKNAAAGSVRLQVESSTKRKGRDAFHVTGQAKTNAVIDQIFPVNDRFESWIDKKNSTSLGYAVYVHEKNTMKNELVFIDPALKTYKRIYERPLRDRQKKITTGVLPHPVQDIVSTLYYVRSLSTDDLGKTEIPVFYGETIQFIKFISKRKETLQLDGQSYQCSVWEPVFKKEGVYQPHPKGSFSVWLSDDAQKIPVKISAQLVVGSIDIVLTKRSPH